MQLTMDDFISFLSNRYGIDKKTLRTVDNFGRLGIDSLSLFSLIEDVENANGIMVNVEDFTDINSVSKMYKCIIDNLKNKKEDENVTQINIK